AERCGAPHGADAEDLVALLVVAAEAAEAEPFENAEWSELRARTGADVPGAEAHRHASLRRGVVDDFSHARMQLQVGCLRDLGLQKRHVRGEERVDRGLGSGTLRRLAERREPGAD